MKRTRRRERRQKPETRADVEIDSVHEVGICFQLEAERKMGMPRPDVTLSR
jgi:hypothetical protein